METSLPYTKNVSSRKSTCFPFHHCTCACGQPTIPRPPYLGQSLGMSRTWKKPVLSYVSNKKRLLPSSLGAVCSMVAQSKVPGKSTLGPRVAPSCLPVHPWKVYCPKSPGRSHSPCSGLHLIPYSSHIHSKRAGFHCLVPQPNLSDSHQ